MSDLYNQAMNFIVSKPCPKCGKHFLSYDMPHSLLYFCKCSNCDFFDDRQYIEILPGNIKLLSPSQIDILRISDQKVRKHTDLINLVKNVCRNGPTNNRA
jgi:hypothetical protein